MEARSQVASFRGEAAGLKLLPQVFGVVRSAASGFFGD